MTGQAGRLYLAWTVFLLFSPCSTVAASINALATVTFEDFVKSCFPHLSDKLSTWTSKGLCRYSRWVVCSLRRNVHSGLTGINAHGAHEEFHIRIHTSKDIRRVTGKHYQLAYFSPTLSLTVFCTLPTLYVHHFNISCLCLVLTTSISLHGKVFCSLWPGTLSNKVKCFLFLSF